MKLTKTGNKRYRVETRLFNAPLVVLQLEWNVSGDARWDNSGGIIDYETIPDYKEWRDATVEDLTEGL